MLDTVDIPVDPASPPPAKFLDAARAFRAQVEYSDNLYNGLLNLLLTGVRDRFARAPHKPLRADTLDGLARAWGGELTDGFRLGLTVERPERRALTVTEVRLLGGRLRRGEDGQEDDLGVQEVRLRCQ